MKLRKLLSLVLATVMLLGCMTVTAFAEDNVDYLDLESTATYAEKTDVDQNYTLTQASEEYTDVTKVKLEWTITDIAATYTSNKTWDPDTLTWKETKTVGELANKTAEFTLTNYSSKKVVGTVSFKAEDAVSDTLTSATFDENNGKIIDTVVNSDHTIDETKKTNVPSNKITATLKFNADKFADLSATTSATKYGTYTVTLTEKKDATVTAPTTKTTGLTYSNSEQELVNAGITDGGTWQYKLNDGEYSTTVPKAKDAGTYTVYYKLVGGANYNDIAEENVQVTIAKKDATITTTNVTKEYTYTGSEQTVNSGATVDSGAALTYTNNTFTDRPSNGKQTVTISAAETTNFNAASTTVEITINKANQTAPSAPEKASATSASVTLTAVSAGQGDTKYGYNTTNTAPTTWQDGVEFTGLTASTTYYFFAKYEGNNNYNEAISTIGTEIKTEASIFTFTAVSYDKQISSAVVSENTLVVTGKTWAEVITANKDKTVNIKIGDYNFVCKLVSFESYVLLNEGTSYFLLFAENATTEPDNVFDSNVKLDDVVTGTLYFEYIY